MHDIYNAQLMIQFKFSDIKEDPESVRFSCRGAFTPDGKNSCIRNEEPFLQSTCPIFLADFPILRTTNQPQVLNSDSSAPIEPSH